MISREMTPWHPEWYPGKKNSGREGRMDFLNIGIMMLAEAERKTGWHLFKKGQFELKIKILKSGRKLGEHHLLSIQLFPIHDEGSIANGVNHPLFLS